MSDSPTRPVSIELERGAWEMIAGYLPPDLGRQIVEQLPLPVPRLIGAVIEARRSGEASTQIYVRATIDAPGYNAWRHADLDGKWENSDALEVVHILSPGVDL